MKLYIKQKVFSWRDQFAIKDEFGNDRWFAQGEIFSWGRKLHLCDNTGQEVAFIHQKMWTFLPRYFIELGGYTYTLVQEFAFFRPKFHLEGIPWRMEGNFMAHDYTLYNAQELIMQMQKHWFTWGDSYELDIPNPANEVLALCISLAVDCINADSSSSSYG